MDPEIRRLKLIANSIRNDILVMTHAAQPSRRVFPPSTSATWLYFP